MVTGVILKKLEANHADIQNEIRFAKVALGLLKHEKGHLVGIRDGVASAVNEVVERLGA
jgi:hypothetical protein